MSPLPLSSEGFNLWEWINAYGSGIDAIAGVAAALVAVFDLLSAAFDSRARSQPMVTAEFRSSAESDISAEMVIITLILRSCCPLT